MKNQNQQGQERQPNPGRQQEQQQQRQQEQQQGGYQHQTEEVSLDEGMQQERLSNQPERTEQRPQQPNRGL